MTEVSTNYLYKRSDHLLDHLNRICGTENTKIDEDTINNIKKELILMNINFNEVTRNDIKVILKKTNKHKYYNNINKILKFISNNEGLQISIDERKNICELYMRFYKAYTTLMCNENSKFCYRRDFFSYNFILKKICYMLGYDNIAKEFTQLKSQCKMKDNENRWKELCEVVEPNYSKLF